MNESFLVRREELLKDLRVARAEMRKEIWESEAMGRAIIRKD